MKVQKTESEFLEAFQHCLVDTLWRGVKELPPAHFMVYDVVKRTHKIKPHWEFKPRTINVKTAREELEDLLEDAINLRTRSDVPYGLYYSGGIDSALISTFHDFEHKFFFDDTKNWKKDFFDNIDKISYHIDFPVGALGLYPLFKLAQMASKKVKVVLDGIAADEIFGGYVRYMPIAHEWQLRQEFPSYDYLFGKYFPTHLDGFTGITARNENKEFVREKLRPYFDMFDDPISAMCFADFKLILPSLLQMGDRMAGMFGIENRAPFLDRRVIEFGHSLPANLKINSPEQKVILRKILTKRGLTEPLRMEKKGLSIYFNSWFGRKDWDRSFYLGLLKERWHDAYHA